MAAGTIVEPIDLRLAADRLVGGLFVRDEVGAEIDENEKGVISVRRMHPGMDVPHDFYDEQGLLLLRAGALVTRKVIEQVRRRGIRRLLPATKVPGRSKSRGRATASTPARRLETTFDQTPTTRHLDKLIDRQPAPPPRNGARRHGPGARLDLASLRGQVDAGADRLPDASGRLADLLSDLLAGRSRNLGAAADLVSGLVETARRDPSIAPMLLDHERHDEYLYAHCLNVCLVTIAMTMNRGLSHDMVVDAAVGALLHDVGMLRIARSIRFAPRSLSDEEWVELERHPVLSIDTLERYCPLRPVSLIAAYQAHERGNMSGYPRGTAGRAIHPVAAIVAVADVYAAMTCPRPHRTAVTPFRAVTTLLHEAGGGRLERDAVRDFLDVMSLFPVGSLVKLTDDTKARVLRANGRKHKQPVVVPLNADGSETDCEIDLSRDGAGQVVATLEEADVARVFG